MANTLFVTCISEHYSPGYAELKYGEKSTGIENLLTVFDSGSTYTYLISSAYQAFISLVSEIHFDSVFQTLVLEWHSTFVLIIWTRL